MIVGLYKNLHNAKNETITNESRSNMGLLWEIVQTGLMYGQHRKTDTIEDRMQALEQRLDATQNTLRTLVKKLEEMQGTDIDGDGRVG
jgi:bisphosphoglycerate-dependent phosphoglycerate mutase